MRLLLDTRTLIWAPGNPDRLDGETRSLIEDGANEILSSAAGIWEIAIKARLGRLDFALRPEAVARAARATGFGEIAVDAETAARVIDLPMHHRDPFDRLLVAQALAGPMRLYTADPQLLPYSELVTLIR